MRYLIYYFWITLCASLLFTSCEKDNITNTYIDQNPGRQDKVAEDLRRMIVASKDGWVMMVKSSLSADVYSPVVLKFDTATNRVYINTVYGVTSDTEDYFRIAKGTGAPQLIFTTGSIMSTLYRVGAQASDITDHIYNVKSVSDSEIEIQPYRSGNVYAKEGGVIYKLFRRPKDWAWADSSLIFDWTNAAFRKNVIGVKGQMKIENSISKTVDSIPFTFNNLPSGDDNWLMNNSPFAIRANIGTGGFKAATGFQVISNITTDGGAMVMQGQNTISFYPFSIYSDTKTNVTALVNRLKTHYLIFKNQTRVGSNVKMEFEAYDKAGKVILKAYYDNLK